MAITVREVPPNDYESITPLLLLAEPSRRALRYSLRHMSDAAYALDADGELVAAATMRWDDPAEIVELAVREERHGEGFGREMVDWLIAEGRRRGVREVVVGTSSTSAGNILFYQKCGFRVHDIRLDYFWYYDEPRYENGLVVRDMIVFRRAV